MHGFEGRHVLIRIRGRVRDRRWGGGILASDTSYWAKLVGCFVRFEHHVKVGEARGVG